MNEYLLSMPQWTTGSRLLKLGEGIDFQFAVPAGMDDGELTVFPRYLERADPGDRFVAGGNLRWVDGLKGERVPLELHEGRASVTYVPEEPGSYLARWRVGEEELFRYFSAIEDDWLVVRFSTFVGLDPEPGLHGAGIPLDYRLPVERFDAEDPLFRKFLGYHRHYGNTIIPAFPDAPHMNAEERVDTWGRGLSRVRALLPDESDARSARVEMHHALDPGYAEALMRLGVNDHCGLWAANGESWLGMPEFPYFSSPVDCRKPNQEEGGALVGHQWDFCGGWHFLGPVSWHYAVSEGRWGMAEECLRHGMEEAEGLTEMSGHPAFLVPLYDGVTRYYAYPNALFREGFEGERMLRFVERYQQFMAFEATKARRLAYARSIDIADYYRRHFRVTPRTVFASKTDHLFYDMWWLPLWSVEGRLVPRERIPWLTRISTLMGDRKVRKHFGAHLYKDPLSCEYILVEDQRRQMRFERECPNPVWWFDYTRQEIGLGGSAITHTETPDVEIERSGWAREDGGLEMRLWMRTRAEFPDYAIALWGLPEEFEPGRFRVETNAREFIVARNRDGERHLVLFFDLRPDAEITVRLCPVREG